MKRTMTFPEWNRLMTTEKVEDLSHELPNSFLLFGQVMRAKIRLDGVVYKVSAWSTGEVQMEPL